jgi:hypothetical protein
MDKYADIPMDLAAATLVALAEELASARSSRSIRTSTYIGFVDASDSRWFHVDQRIALHRRRSLLTIRAQCPVAAR